MMKKQTAATVIGITAIALSSFLVADDAQAAKNVRYECTNVSDVRVLTLPVAPLGATVAQVQMVFHGDKLEATYVRNGLSQYWYLTDELYVELKPNLMAYYWDFEGAEDGESVTSEATFWCKKRG